MGKRKHSSKSRKSSHRQHHTMSEPPLIATAGALGNESKGVKRKKRSKKRSATTLLDGGVRTKRSGRKSKKSSKLLDIQPGIPVNVPAANTVPPAFDEAPKPEFSNLATRPDALLRSPIGVKKQEVKSCLPFYGTGNLNTESFFHFSIRSSKHEWIRFRPDALSITIYGQHRNGQYVANSVVPRQQPTHIALQARTSAPAIMMDPSVMGTGFFKKVETSVNNNYVHTNSSLGINLLPQYARINRVFVAKAEPHFTKSTQYSYEAEFLKKKVMQAATAPFDYNAWNSRQGVRIPVYLDGIFPFDMKSAILESMDNQKEPNLYFPPDTTLEFKFYTHTSKMEAIWHPEVGMAEYFDKAQALANVGNYQLRFTFQDALLEYESIELHPSNHIEAIENFKAGHQAIYEYDIPRGQHQALLSGSSYTENTFQIMPYARFAIIMFVQDWSIFVMDNLRRPLSGFSRFPKDCTKMQIGFAGDKTLITDSFERFGVAGEQHQISKKIFYEYLKAKRLTSDAFDDFFPKNATDIALNQAIPIDLRSHVSKNTELLTVQCEFAGGTTSPTDIQVVCISIHPNGKATVRSGKDNYSWVWEFHQAV